MAKPEKNPLPHLSESLEKLRDEQVRPEGLPSGLGHHNLDRRDPEIEDPHRVSNTHPFREVKDGGGSDEGDGKGST